jgi:hypothetical protein
VVIIYHHVNVDEIRKMPTQSTPNQLFYKPLYDLILYNVFLFLTRCNNHGRQGIY